MTQEKYDIFISYRRKDENGKEWGTSIARNIEQALEERGYKGRVFFDHNQIGAEDFEKKILGAIKQAKVFLCVLTKNAMDNCVNEGDWVRREICQAKESGLNIIFLNPDNEFNHNLLPNNFPKELEIIKTQNSLEIRSGQKFEVDIDHIVEKYIRPIVPCKDFSMSKYQAGQVIAKVLVKSDCDCLVYNFEQELGLAKATEYTEFNLPIGENELKFVVSNFPHISNTQIVRLERDSQKRVVVELKAKLDEYLSTLPDNEFEIFKGNENYGFRLKSTRNVIVPAKYDSIGSFNEGMAWVKLNGKYGFIDKTGKEVISLKYDFARAFSEGLAAVRLNDRWGFVDKTGGENIPLKYDYVEDFSKDVAIVNRDYVINKRGSQKIFKTVQMFFAEMTFKEKLLLGLCLVVYFAVVMIFFSLGGEIFAIFLCGFGLLIIIEFFYNFILL
ncbi:MAG: TIR domain-containing protein [Rikenellaceae bacterium]|nr:TIR domain-containing protein [Rikenellaceae bacterium]